MRLLRDCIGKPISRRRKEKKSSNKGREDIEKKEKRKSKLIITHGGPRVRLNLLPN